ncbi:MAG: O-acetyl-ADP-ribose deacetylase [Peptococcaceae bacterium]|nr:MAG: O-acetyl-ADP-ribose deacetylase [Peptococcaceae bacterium]
MQVKVGGTLLTLMQGDITRQDTEAIVNAANSSLMGGGGVDGAIHRAGGLRILAECREIVARQGKLPPGRAVITGGGNLKARYVIHTVGPVWSDGSRGEDEVLRSAYHSSLSLAREKGISSLSFPSISTGAYRFPIARAARIALSTVRDFCREHQFKEVRFVLFSEKDLQVYEKMLTEGHGEEQGGEAIPRRGGL